MHFSSEMLAMELKSRELMLALAFAMLGFAFSSRRWLSFLNCLSPSTGLIVYYAILFGCLCILSRMELAVFGFKIKEPMQTLGLLLITFAFFICINWESPYVQLVTTGSVENISPVLFQSEDGAVWYVWQSTLPWADTETLRILTYVLTPFTLALTGGLLVSEKVKLGW